MYVNLYLRFFLSNARETTYVFRMTKSNHIAQFSSTAVRFHYPFSRETSDTLRANSNAPFFSLHLAIFSLASSLFLKFLLPLKQERGSFRNTICYLRKRTPYRSLHGGALVAEALRVDWDGIRMGSSRLTKFPQRSFDRLISANRYRETSLFLIP